MRRFRFDPRLEQQVANEPECNAIMVIVEPRIELLRADSPVLETVLSWHWHEWSHGYESPSLPEWRKQLASRSRDDGIPFTLVAYLDQEPVGCLSVSADDRDERFGDRGPWLSGMLVLGVARNLGVGHALLLAAGERAISMGATELWVWTTEAGPFYERCGYQYAHHKAHLHDSSVLWQTL